MWKQLLLFCAIAQVAHGACPAGYDMISCDGRCGGSYTRAVLTPENAIETVIAKCDEIHGQPVIIHDAEEQQFWMKRASADASSPLLLLGLSCNSTSNKFVWTDGSALDYKPSLRDSRFDKPCVSGDRFYLTYNGMWNAWNGTNKSFKADISCAIPTHPMPIDNGCGAFDFDAEDGVCYQVGETAASWKDAQMICQKLGADLASIHNVSENSFLRRLAMSKGVSPGLYLGATLTGKAGFGDFGWIDGSTWNYANFGPGFPKPGFGDCIAMDTTTSEAQWMNIACTQELPYSCVREKKITPEPTCSTEIWKEGSIITSPGFPYNASMPCDFFLMVDVGYQVEVEILLLEANYCTDRLVIYDGYFGTKVLATLTGDVRNQRYTSSGRIMRVSWQPKGKVGVMGLSMTFRAF